ncbi:MAG: ribonuclease HII [Chitinophagales bacterium]|nr:ribonuclease HII [Chitinophagales bacterium]
MLASRFDCEYIHQVGCDEAGRGCLAGPVVAAAVLLPADFSCDMLDDSKKLTATQREYLRDFIINRPGAYGIGVVSHEEIDQINILQASFLAMHRAIEQINRQMDLLLIDGNRFKPYKSIPYQCIVKGDGKYQSIAAASILAKTYRDHLMVELDKQFPIYQWKKNKGYASASHIAAIEKQGYSPIHRKTFKLKKLSKQLYLSF